MGTEGESGLTLNCQTYPTKDGTWTVQITTVWDRGEYPLQDFYDHGYTSQEAAERFMKIKANQIKELMENL